jgi:hypothetical protein
VGINIKFMDPCPEKESISKFRWFAINCWHAHTPKTSTSFKAT